VVKPIFRRYSISLDADTIDICRQLARTQSLSVSATIRQALHEAFRRAVKKGRIAEVVKERA
jgi:Ribbon-helix-helix protein, copG family